MTTKPQTDLEEIKELSERARAYNESIDRRVEVKTDETVALTPEELKARNRRNLWIALSIGAFVLLVFLITMVKVKDGLIAGAS